jgi:CelD/BcsL family acetyltransferase involved in cellulose biosynthesis
MNFSLQAPKASGRRQIQRLDRDFLTQLATTDISPSEPVAWVATDAGRKESSRAVYRVEPLRDPRWEEFLKRTPEASLFHSRQWLQALQQAYGYEPIVFTTSAPGEELENGIVLCEVNSWLTGRRLVSVPFSDHCDLLVPISADLRVLIRSVEEELRLGNWSYAEVRPATAKKLSGIIPTSEKTYYHHQLNLEPSLDELFRNLHKSSIQRKIQKAERENLEYQEGVSERFLDAFYELLVHTRRRHCVPPQPKKWFRILTNSFGEALKIRIASKDGRPVAAMLTIRHKDSLIYKYGGSHPQFRNLGGMHLLYWKSIQEAKSAGLKSFDLGRTDAHQQGLITFKRRWGADESTLTYWRFSGSRETDTSHMFDLCRESWRVQFAKQVFRSLPTSVLPTVGGLLYKHVG